MPHAIHLYRPQRTAPEYLEAISVGRETILQEILERLGSWQPGSSRQHYLIIGPRGIGKTYLLQLIEHRISKNAELSLKWYPVVLPEENYGITRVSDLLIQALHLLSSDSADADLAKVYEQVKFDDGKCQSSL